MPPALAPLPDGAIAAAVDQGLGDLLGALRIPSVSARGEGLRESADYLRTLLDKDGWSAEVVEVEGNPVVFAETGPAGAPTIVLYGHHDVQPVDPESAWTTPPFEPVIRDGSIYARGSADNKGQFFCHIFAARALAAQPGIRLKLVLDGQEEIGSPQFPAFVERRRRRLEGARLCLTADGPTRLPGQPEVAYGVRGALKLRLTVRTAATDLHSGNWGNIVPSAAWRLAQVLAALKGPDGRVTVPGFYHDAVGPTDDEREALAAIPFRAEEARASVGGAFLDGPPDVPMLERLMFMPTFNVAGIQGGYTGPGSRR